MLDRTFSDALRGVPSPRRRAPLDDRTNDVDARAVHDALFPRRGKVKKGVAPAAGRIPDSGASNSSLHSGAMSPRTLSRSAIPAYEPSFAARRASPRSGASPFFMGAAPRRAPKPTGGGWPPVTAHPDSEDDGDDVILETPPGSPQTARRELFTEATDDARATPRPAHRGDAQRAPTPYAFSGGHPPLPTYGNPLIGGGHAELAQRGDAAHAATPYPDPAHAVHPIPPHGDAGLVDSLPSYGFPPMGGGHAELAHRGDAPSASTPWWTGEQWTTAPRPSRREPAPLKLYGTPTRSIPDQERRSRTAAMRSINPCRYRLTIPPPEHPPKRQRRVPRPQVYNDAAAEFVNDVNEDYYNAWVAEAGQAAQQIARTNPSVVRQAAGGHRLHGLKLKTTEKYRHVWKLKFQPWFDKHLKIQCVVEEDSEGVKTSREYSLRDITPQDVMIWMTSMAQGGTCGGATIRQYVISCRGAWIEAMEQAGASFEETGEDRNPFAHKSVQQLIKTFNNRMVATDKFRMRVKSPLCPEDAFLMLRQAVSLANEFLKVFGYHNYTEFHPNGFTHNHFVDFRNSLACLVGYAWGLRATTLFTMDWKTLRVVRDKNNEIETVEFLRPPTKNIERALYSHSQPRRYPTSHFSKTLGFLIETWHRMKPAMYAYRMRPGCSGAPDDNNMLPLNHEEILNTYEAFKDRGMGVRQQLDEHLGRVTFDDVSNSSWMWHLPRETIPPDKHYCTTVTAWLRRALKQVGRTEGECERITSHILRAGGASGFVLANPGQLNKANWCVPKPGPRATRILFR